MQLTLALVGPVVRALPWRAFTLPLVVGGGFVAIATLAASVVDLRWLHPFLRLASTLAAVGCAYAFDDASAWVLATTPTSLLRVRLLRMAIIGPIVAVWWLALIALVRLQVDPAVWDLLPVIDFAVELGALAAIALALAALGTMITADRSGGAFAAPALLVGAGVAALASARLPLFASVFDPRWAHAHRVWRLLFVLAATAAVVASTDPVAARLRRR